MSPRQQELLQRMRQCYQAGTSMMHTAVTLGISTKTVRRYFEQFHAAGGEEPRCGCGRYAYHSGGCLTRRLRRQQELRTVTISPVLAPVSVAPDLKVAGLTPSLGPLLYRTLTVEAVKRGMSWEQLTVQLLTTIATDNLFAAVLDG